MNRRMTDYDFLLQAQISEIKATLYTMTLFIFFPLSLIIIKMLAQNPAGIQILVTAVCVAVEFVLLCCSKKELKKSTAYFRMWAEICAEEEYKNAIQEQQA